MPADAEFPEKRSSELDLVDRREGKNKPTRSVKVATASGRKISEIMAASKQVVRY
jgi:hypothetical protein